MGFFGKMIKATTDTALLPVEVVKDVATFGGELDGEGESYTAKRAKKLAKDLEDAADDVSEGDFF